MPFSIRPERSFKSEFHKVAKRQLRHAIDVLEQQPSGLDEAIHEARKRLKRVRSLYRLVSREKPKFFVRENARLRKIARSLSSSVGGGRPAPPRPDLVHADRPRRDGHGRGGRPAQGRQGPR
jgi:hypothetical protein